LTRSCRLRQPKKASGRPALLPGVFTEHDRGAGYRYQLSVRDNFDAGHPDQDGRPLRTETTIDNPDELIEGVPAPGA
jgi:hypothetical protein